MSQCGRESYGSVDITSFLNVPMKARHAAKLSRENKKKMSKSLLNSS
jgi:hypothetical protein